MIHGLPFPTSSEAGSGMSVLIPPVFEIFWAAVAGLLIWLAVGRALPMIYKMIDERRDLINEGLDAASRAKDEAALAHRDHDALLHQAGEEARHIREEANEDAQRIVAEARSLATHETNRIHENSKRQIEAERQAAFVSLKSDVGELATELAERIVGEQLKDKELSARVIDRFMDELENDLKDSTSSRVSA